MNGLTAEIAAKEDELSQLDNGTAAWAAAKSELNELKARQAEQAVEEKVHEEIRFAIPGVDFTKLPAELVTIIELVVKADRRRTFNEHAVELDQIEKERDEIRNMYDSSKASYDILQEDYNTCERELKEQTDETIRIIAERDEARKNRDNAVAQLNEAKAEIERLKSEVDDYQKAKVFGEKESQSVIDVTPDEADNINKAINTYLTSEDWGSVIKVVKPDGTFERVKRDEFESDWSQITPPSLGGSESTESFPEEAAETDIADGGVSDSTVAPPFPDEEEPAVHSNTIVGAVVQEPVSRAEYEALAERVTLLEQSKGVAA